MSDAPRAGTGRPARPVCVLTDYGLEDEFVGVLHRVVLAVAPGTEIIDLAHRIPRQDVRAGALCLWRVAPWIAPAVVLAVVDPGVATGRRAVAVEVATGSGPLTLVGPDNGLLTPCAHRAGTITAAVELTAASWQLPAGPGVGTTFAGRDVFAPVAGLLAAGAPLAGAGTPIDPPSLAGGPLALARPARAGGATRVDATVLWVDAFGNAQLDVAAADLPATGRATLRMAGAGGAPSGGGPLGGGAATAGGGGAATAGGGGAAPVEAVLARAYADLGDRLGLVPDSSGLVALCLDRASAAARLGLAAGDGVALTIHPER